MKQKNLWIAAASGAVLTTLLSDLPLIMMVNCLVCIGFWGSSVFSVWLYRRLNGGVTVREAVRIGALTGVLAGLLSFLLSFAGVSGLQGFVNNVSPLLSAEELQGLNELPSWGTLLFSLFGLVFNVAFGTLGGWIGGTIFTRKPKAQNSVDPTPAA